MVRGLRVEGGRRRLDAGYARREAQQRYRIPGHQRQIVEGRMIEREFFTAIAGIQKSRL